jgi:hypothetical protein
MWAPLVALQTYKPYCIYCHSRTRTSGVTDAAASLNHCFECWMLWMRTLWTIYFTYPRNKNPGMSGPESVGALASIRPPSLAPWKCLIKKFRNNIGAVRRSAILLKCHIVIISLGYCKRFQHVEVIVWCHSAFHNHAISGKSTPHINLGLSCSWSTKSCDLSLAHVLTLCRWTYPEIWKWPHHWTLHDVKTARPYQFY